MDQTIPPPPRASTQQAASASASSLLTPGQVIVHNNAQQQQQPPQKRRPRRRRPNKNPATTTIAAVANNDNNNQTAAAKTKQQDNGASKSSSNNNNQQQQTEPTASHPTATTRKPSKRNRSKRNKKNNKKQQKQPPPPKQQQQQQPKWWVPHLPDRDALDPITLERLSDLPYPPFALSAAHPPYNTGVVREWPPPQNNNTTNDNDDRQAQILQQQWGSERVVSVLGGVSPKQHSPKHNDPQHPQQQHYNLFDGWALAYYMVHAQQFIDPLNRRDLSIHELRALDRYLARYHNFNNNNTDNNQEVLSVVDAYHRAGQVLSTAGAAATTVHGRARLLQDQARVWMETLFVTTNTTNPSSARREFNNTNNSTLAQQYQQHQASIQLQQEQARITVGGGDDNHTVFDDNDTTGIYGTNNFRIIDDDLQPGLRSNAPVPTLLYASSSSLANVHGSHPAATSDFPALQQVAAAVVETTSNDNNNKPKIAATTTSSSTLSKTVNRLVQKTDPNEQQRQWQAREAARRKAARSRHTEIASRAVPKTTTTTTSEPTVAQLERNQAFAQALGVQRSGWARLGDRSNNNNSGDNALLLPSSTTTTIATVYPDTLIRHAKESLRPNVLLKLEKKWKTFLRDDRAASLPLTPMDRPTRAFVHQYSEFWRLHTESFDREPKRYIHCVKLPDTSAPHPLLSEAMRDWKGPPSILLSDDHTVSQTAGQITRSWRGNEPRRTPLELRPKSSATTTATTQVAGLPLGGAPHRTMQPHDKNDNHPPSRFSALAEGKERPKLALAKRTLPLERPPCPMDKNNNNKVERHCAKIEAQRARAEHAQRTLQAAFASDSDESEEWEEQEAVYVGSD